MGNVTTEVNVREKNSTNVLIVAKGSSITFGGLLIAKAVGFLIEVLLARYLGAQSYGVYSLTSSVFGIPDSFTNLGLPQTVVRYGAIYRDERNFSKLKGLLLGSAIIVLFSSLSGAVLLFYERNVVAMWFSQPAIGPLLSIMTWVSIPSGFIMIVGAFLRVHYRYDLDVVARQLIQPVTALVLIVILVRFINYETQGAVISILIASLVSAGVGAFFIIRIFPQILTSLRPIYNLKNWLRYAIPTLLLGTSYLLMRHSSRLLLGYFSSAETVGIYTAASVISNNLTIFLDTINPVFAPIISALNEHRHKPDVHKDLENTFQTATRWMITLTLPVFILVWVYSKDLMLLFGSNFQSAYIVLFVLSLAQLINVGTGPVGLILQMTGKQDLDFLNGIMTLLLNILLGLLFIPKYGAFGAGLAATIALSTVHIIRLAEVYYLLKMTPYTRSFVKCLIAAGVTLLFVLLFNGKVHIVQVIWRILIGVGIIGLIYSGVLFGLGLEPSDKDVLRRIIARIGLTRYFSSIF